jgi:hypothetical protein
MRRRRLIDAHNVMHKIGAIADRLPVNHSDAFSHFAAIVAGAGRLDGIGSTIVFDGPKIPVNRSGSGVTILFSHPLTADEQIRSMIRQGDARGRWIVVTDDQEILDDCRMAGVATQRTTDFIEQLSGVAASTARASAGRAGASRGKGKIPGRTSGTGTRTVTGSGAGSGSGSVIDTGTRKSAGSGSTAAQPDPGENPNLRVKPSEVDELLRLFREGSDEA